MTGTNPNRWDKAYKDFKGSRLSIWNEQPSGFFVEHIPLLKQRGFTSLLDAGCGDGRNIGPFAHASLHITAIDSSSEAIRRAKERYSTLPNVTILQKDIVTFNSSKRFDAILCDYVILHHEHPERVVEAFQRLLKQNGVLLVNFLTPEDPSFGKGTPAGYNAFIAKEVYTRFFNLEEVKRLLNGFHILEHQEVIHEDPEHVPDYPRPERHKHHSIFIVAEMKKK